MRHESFLKGPLERGLIVIEENLVHGEQHPAVRRVGLDFAGQGKGGLELGVDPDPAADLLGEDLVPGDALRAERVQLRLELLSEVAAAGVPDADARPGAPVSGAAGGGVPGRQGWQGPRSAGVPS